MQAALLEGTFLLQRLQVSANHSVQAFLLETLGK